MQRQTQCSCYWASAKNTSDNTLQWMKCWASMLTLKGEKLLANVQKKNARHRTASTRSQTMCWHPSWDHLQYGQGRWIDQWCLWNSACYRPCKTAWVHFATERVGKKAQQHNPRHPADIDCCWTPSQRVGRDFPTTERSDIKVLRLQIPLTQISARTIHHTQEATIKEKNIVHSDNQCSPSSAICWMQLCSWHIWHICQRSRLPQNNSRCRCTSWNAELTTRSRSANHLHAISFDLMQAVYSFWRLSTSICQSNEKRPILHAEDLQCHAVLKTCDVKLLSKQAICTWVGFLSAHCSTLQAAVTKNSLHCTSWAEASYTVLSVALPKWLDWVLRDTSGAIMSVQYAVQTPSHACFTSKKSWTALRSASGLQLLGN